MQGVLADIDMIVVPFCIRMIEMVFFFFFLSCIRVVVTRTEESSTRPCCD
jgi:hypothetical protein